jgi:hypothetical protein
MTQLQLYINDQLVDLSDDQPIALTFQINNLAEVKNQQGNTSNQFKLPLTQRNRQILGFPDEVAFTTALPYQKYQAKLIQDGLEIIPYGIAELNGIDQDKANITILSGNVDFFDAIDGKLYEMGDSTSPWSNYGQNLVWKPYDHIWNLDNVVNSQNHTDGWIWPVVDYGAIDPVILDNPIDVRYQRPGFFIKTAIDLLMKSSGYKATGSLLADPLYPLMIAQFSNGSFEHGTDYQNQVDNRGMSAANSGKITLNHPAVTTPAGVIKWDSVISDASRQFSGNTLFTANNINTVAITITFPHVFLRGRVTPQQQSSKLSVYIYYRDPNYPSTPDTILNQYDFSFDGHGEKKSGNPSGSDPNGWTRISGNGSSIVGSIDILNTTISAQTTLPKNGGIYVGYIWHGLTPCSAVIYPGCTFVIESQNATVQFGQTIQCERIFPDISQKDFLKDTLQRFGIMCQTDNTSKTISFNSFRDIINNIPVAKDWSSKCLNQGKQVSFQLGNYAQVNYMKYQNDDNVLPSKFGWSQVNINDQTLPASGDLFVSPFAATLNRPFYGGTIAQILMIDNKSSNVNFSIGVSPRILIDQKLDIGQLRKTVTFTDGDGNSRVVNDIISTPYFYKSDAPELEPGYGSGSLLFDDLRKRYSPQLEKILKQTKKVVRYILLTPRDILELNLLIPIYLQQDSAYYYINKVDAWRKGQPTKVEFVKLD